MSQIAEILLPVPLSKTFDYIIDNNVEVGQRVLVEFGKTKSQVGIVMNLRTITNDERNNDALKPIDKVLDNFPIVDENWRDLIEFASRYYVEPLGKAYKNAFPKRLRVSQPVFPPRLATYQLSETGKKVLLEQSLPKNATKQLSLLTFIGRFPCVTSSKLRTQGFSRSDIKKSIDKAYITQKKSSPYCEKNTISLPYYQINNEQKQIVEEITPALSNFKAHLIYGITGSGKTEVYIHLITQALSMGKQVLLLVPEIALTPQMLGRFTERFGNRVAAYHSGMTDIARGDVFLAAQAGELPVLIGTRSSIFVPMKNLGLILIDEEHDLSYKQHEGFLYNARDLAIYRAKQLNINVVLGSATPSLESVQNVCIGKFQRHKLSKRATDSVLPEILMVDRRGQPRENVISDKVIQKMRQTLQQGKQVLLFLNRRGFAPVMKCNQCSWSSDCPTCSVFQTAHIATRQLCCHHCGHTESLPVLCPDCHGSELYFAGSGTQKLESQIQQQFPKHHVLRLDRDKQKTAKQLDEALVKVQSGEVDIILGTQLVVKGHHFPNVEMVCVVDADSALYSSDFRAEERLYQQLIQVAGRAGRESNVGQVYIQSSIPEHDVFHALMRYDYWAYATKILSERQKNRLPPHTAMTLIKASARDKEVLLDYLRRVKATVQEHVAPLEIFGPVPLAVEKIKNRFQAKLWLSAKDKTSMQKTQLLLQEIIKHHDKSNRFKTIIDIDAT